MSINEALCICRIAKGLGFKAQSIPSHSAATFVGVKVSGVTNPMSERKFIVSSFQSLYGEDKRLDFSTNDTPYSELMKEVTISILA